MDTNTEAPMNTNQEAPMDTNPKPKLMRKCPINCIRLVITLEDTAYNRLLLAEAYERAVRHLGTVEGTLGITKLEQLQVVVATEPKSVPLPTTETPD